MDTYAHKSVVSNNACWVWCNHILLHLTANLLTNYVAQQVPYTVGVTELYLPLRNDATEKLGNHGSPWTAASSYQHFSTSTLHYLPFIPISWNRENVHHSKIKICPYASVLQHHPMVFASAQPAHLRVPYRGSSTKRILLECVHQKQKTYSFLSNKTASRPASSTLTLLHVVFFRGPCSRETCYIGNSTTSSIWPWLRWK